MISNEISLIRQNSELSADLAAAMESFLNEGGTIATLHGFVHQPKPAAKAYGRNHDARKPKAQKALSEKASCVHIDALKAAKEKERIELESKVRELATRMTLAEAIRKTGISKHRLRKIAGAGGFRFLRYDPTPALKPNRADRTGDAANVALIKSARDRGLSRNEASTDLKISYALMKRLITEYAIDYPKHKPGRK
ncbi:hypothetical protein [Pseudomonas ovata]|uniref:hypothetical protein n=1 Tax=Pseudomonas ovata TaxID=1839709 RepID=UPI000D687B7E|nr:hypothetical protein [Pseudomonas ovata]